MEIKPIINKSVDTLNEIGSNTVDKVTYLKNTAKDVFERDPKATELLKKAKSNNIGKETFIGAGILLAITALAVKCIKGINRSIKNIKNS